MKKEYIAIYIGLPLFMITFIGSALLNSTGHKHQSQIGIAISLVLLGTTMMVGIYSNIKNYGYFWANVRQRDRTLSFEKMDEKYPRTERGTWRYRIVIGGVTLAAFSIITAGVVLLIREL